MEASPNPNAESALAAASAAARVADVAAADLNELMCVANEWKIEKHFEATVATIPSDIGQI